MSPANREKWERISKRAGCKPKIYRSYRRNVGMRYVYLCSAK